MNMLENLMYGTRSENLRGLTRHGQRNLTYKQASEIRRRFVRKCPVNGGVAMAAEFGVLNHVVYGITSKGQYLEK